MKYILLLALNFALALNSYSSCIEGEGKTIEDKVFLPNIHSLEINVPMNLNLTQSKDQSITIRSSQDILENLKFEYNDGKIIFTERKDICPKDLTVYISLDKLREIEINSACKLTSTGKFESEDFDLDVNGSAEIDLSIDAEDIDIEFEGSGSLMIKGSCEDLDLNLDGNGKIDASNLASDNVDVSLDGAGEIKINPKNALNANLNGNGKILYKNKPKEVKIEKDGNGIIDQMK